MKALPDHALHEIRGALHDLLGAPLHRALDDERWSRASTPITTWPRKELRPCGDDATEVVRVVDVYIVCEDLWLYQRSLHGTYQYRGAPGAPECHRPTATLDGQMMCACGWRGHAHAQLRIAGGRWWWPVVTIRGAAFYEVCPDARRPDDIDHAPSRWSLPARRKTLDPWEARLSCICGWQSFHSERAPIFLPLS